MNKFISVNIGGKTGYVRADYIISFHKVISGGIESVRGVMLGGMEFTSGCKLAAFAEALQNSVK
ncbi:MAG: hypothetical protein LUC22_00315 [Prevotella sp.]|nr:hypothetical protein [Prevotella sp.]